MKKYKMCIYENSNFLLIMKRGTLKYLKKKEISVIPIQAYNTVVYF